MNNIEISSIVVQVLKKIIQIQAHSCMLDHAGAAYIFLALFSYFLGDLPETFFSIPGPIQSVIWFCFS